MLQLELGGCCIVVEYSRGPGFDSGYLQSFQPVVLMWLVSAITGSKLIESLQGKTTEDKPFRDQCDLPPIHQGISSEGHWVRLDRPILQFSIKGSHRLPTFSLGGGISGCAVKNPIKTEKGNQKYAAWADNRFE